MMTGKDRVRHIVEASLTGLAPVTLTLRLGIISVLFGDFRAVTSGTLDAVGPAESTDGLKTFGVVNERLNVYHGASIAHRARRNKCSLPGERPDRGSAVNSLETELSHYFFGSPGIPVVDHKGS